MSKTHTHHPYSKLTNQLFRKEKKEKSERKERKNQLHWSPELARFGWLKERKREREKERKRERVDFFLSFFYQYIPASSSSLYYGL